MDSSRRRCRGLPPAGAGAVARDSDPRRAHLGLRGIYGLRRPLTEPYVGVQRVLRGLERHLSHLHVEFDAKLADCVRHDFRVQSLLQAADQEVNHTLVDQGLHLDASRAAVAAAPVPKAPILVVQAHQDGVGCAAYSCVMVAFLKNRRRAPKGRPLQKPPAPAALVIHASRHIASPSRGCSALKNSAETAY